jgi:hypothetical protein
LIVHRYGPVCTPPSLRIGCVAWARTRPRIKPIAFPSYAR